MPKPSDQRLVLHSPVGSNTMSPSMKDAVRYARYIYENVRPWLRPPILEIGAGYGTYTPFLLSHGRVVALDIDPGCLNALRARHRAADLDTEVVDLNDHAAIRRCANRGFGSAFSTNVFEHIADDVGAFAALRDAMPAGANLCVIVPAHPELYGYMDSQAGHFRRYTRTTLTHRLRDAGWHVCRSFYINALGGLGWWLTNRLSKPRPLDAPLIDKQLRLYDRFLVPVARMSDFLFRTFFGLSVVAVASKTAQSLRQAA